LGIVLATTLAAGGVKAASCTGIEARMSGKPIIVTKLQDGTTTMLVNSTGTSTTLTPEVSTSWQHCSGLWTTKADKSGSGAGNCYFVDGDGDQWITSWKGTNAGGTWQNQSGTGKYANRTSAKGHWKWATRFANGQYITTWDGDCGG
jgi:hypothetical protein